jgi:hypothetical protein
LARRNRLIEPVTTALALGKVGGFRGRTAEATGRAKDQQHQEVAAAIKRPERFRMKPVTHNQSPNRI